MISSKYFLFFLLLHLSLLHRGRRENDGQSFEGILFFFFFSFFLSPVTYFSRSFYSRFFSLFFFFCCPISLDKAFRIRTNVFLGLKKKKKKSKEKKFVTRHKRPTNTRNNTTIIHNTRSCADIHEMMVHISLCWMNIKVSRKFHRQIIFYIYIYMYMYMYIYIYIYIYIHIYILAAQAHCLSLLCILAFTLTSVIKFYSKNNTS